MNGQFMCGQRHFALAGNPAPDPALGGSPRSQAMAFIRDSNPSPEAGTPPPSAGETRSLDGTFGVAIRSAVTQLERAWLYAGAGIVADSDDKKSGKKPR